MSRHSLARISLLVLLSYSNMILSQIYQHHEKVNKDYDKTKTTAIEKSSFSPEILTLD